MNAVNIGSRREVCWDEFMIDKAEGISIQAHKPERRNMVMECNMPWEGNVSGYFQAFSDNNIIRLYYRGQDQRLDDESQLMPSHIRTVCYAESKDGKSFYRPNIGKITFMGQTTNNIILDKDMDNFTCFRDTNPACPPEEKYKGLHGNGDTEELILYTSADGINFTKKGVLVDDGCYDSLNVCCWNTKESKYYLFYRGVHGEGAVNGKWGPGTATARHTTVIRDVRVRTSKDFVHWDEPQMIQFEPGKEEFELYTNHVQMYYRANHMFIGFPTRYIDRHHDVQNFRHLPGWDVRKKLITKFGRGGTSMTDALVMTSRDGKNFRRTDEAFLTTNIERGTNWFYGDTYPCYGMVETDSDLPGAPREISMYMGDDYRVNAVKLYRYVVRLDGFFSWHCDYNPGKIITKPLTFDGDRLSINFATSAAGYVRIRLLDAMGNAIEGYDSGKLFGNSVDRTVDFVKPLKELANTDVRMEISMRDADLYSFRYENTPTYC